jgi:hypothetical protein
MREGGKPSCIHWKKNGQDEEHCWKLNPEKKLKNFSGKVVQVDIGGRPPFLNGSKQCSNNFVNLLTIF